MVSGAFEESTQEVFSELSSSLGLAYASCGAELQIEAVNKLADLDERVEEFRAGARGQKDEEEANRAYVLRLYLSGVANFLSMWVYVKHDQMELAWGCLVGAQADIACGLRFIDNDEMVEVGKALHLLEQLLFPPQQFVSPSHVYEYANCTICREIYGDCDHVAGRLYLGEMCLQELHGIQPDHVALVNHPKDKICRWIAVRNGDDMHCTLTHRFVESAVGKGETMMATSILAGTTRRLGIARLQRIAKNDVQDGAEAV